MKRIQKLETLIKIEEGIEHFDKDQILQKINGPMSLVLVYNV